jgi:hypothetical protein
MDRKLELLVAQLERLGADDPAGAAESELTENIPQVAFARLERLIRRNLLDYRGRMETWQANLARELELHPESRTAQVAEVFAKCLAAGITLEELARIAEAVAYDTAAGFAYILNDPWDDELGDPDDLPSWVLSELSPENEGGEPTGRQLNGLHEFLGPKD